MGTSIAGKAITPVKLSRILDRTGVVAIGRNEGDRLRACLQSLVSNCGKKFEVVYVDSGSVDGSLELARSLGVNVVELDMSIPFTAGRARNAGFIRLSELMSNLTYVQFIDGDCEMVRGWVEVGVGLLESDEHVAVVCGRRRERDPCGSVYNLLCDIEWNAPTGEVKACGGDSLMRAEALSSVEGFRPDLIAGEEPELCVRLRKSGWRIFRLDSEMCLHDAAMTRFRQWWQRSTRTGYAYAEGASIHGSYPERHGIRSLVSCIAWGFAIPLTMLFMILAGFFTAAAFLLLLYPFQCFRIALVAERSWKENWVHAFFLVIGKVPEFFGVVRFALNRLRGGPARLIEYK